MAAGTEIPQPSSVFIGVHKPKALNSLCPGTVVVGNANSCSKESKGTDSPRFNNGHHGMSRNGAFTQGLVDVSGEEIHGHRSSKDFVPVLRSGGFTDIGTRALMEDEHVRIDDLRKQYGALFICDRPGAFYGVFDGHNGKAAALFVRQNLVKFILEDPSFPQSVGDAVRHAFLQADDAFLQACLVDRDLSSGTTALTVLIFGRTLLVANAGDCRAVLSKGGKAMEMSRDHKPGSSTERARIEALGGYVYDGYLNGQLSVARAIGDWDMSGLKEFGVGGPLIAEPELQEAELAEEDEFLILGCDGLWDVFSSQGAIDFARRRLQQHNDPELCSKEIVLEALRRNSTDNLTALIICFHSEPPRRKFVGRRSIARERMCSLQSLIDGGMVS